MVVLAVGGGLGAVAVSQGTLDRGSFVTPEVTEPELKDGPVMAAGIEMVEGADGLTSGFAQGTHLFDVDELGAKLICLADGSRTIDDLAASLEVAVNPADVASFFVTLGQAGYLSNTVLVNLLEVPE